MMVKQIIAGKRPVLEPDAIFAADGEQVWPPREPRFVFHVTVDSPGFFSMDADGNIEQRGGAYARQGSGSRSWEGVAVSYPITDEEPPFD